jgi:hypothetical protein
MTTSRASRRSGRHHGVRRDDAGSIAGRIAQVYRDRGPVKLMVTSTHKALSELVGDILGWEFLEFDGDRAAHLWTYDFLWSWVFTIAGGTSEIQREITADRLLGLPRAR